MYLFTLYLFVAQDANNIIMIKYFMKRLQHFINEQKEELSTGSDTLTDEGIEKDEKKEIEGNAEEHKKELEQKEELKKENMKQED